jgi:hypothetical protein
MIPNPAKKKNIDPFSYSKITLDSYLQLVSTNICYLKYLGMKDDVKKMIISLCTDNLK